MQENTNWCWKQQPLQHTIIVPTRTITHPRLEVIIIRYVQEIHQKICSMNEANKAIKRHPIIMILMLIMIIFWMQLSVVKIDFERNVSVNSDDEFNR